MTERALPQPRRGAASRWLVGGLVLVGALIGLGLLSQALRQPTPAAPLPVLPTAAPRAIVEANGQLQPVQWAAVSSVLPGRVSGVFVREGSSVAERQVLYQVDTGDQTTSILAPFRGVVAMVNVRQGETVLPGQTSMTIADLSRFEVVTTDLNEYGAARVAIGQRAELRIEAIDGLTTRGVVRSIALMGQTNSTGDIIYRATLDFDLTDPRLRWGMTVRVRFDEPDGR